MPKSGTCGHASTSRGGRGSAENLAMGGGLLHPQDSILRALSVSYTSEGWTSSMKDSIMQCNLLRYRGLCHLTDAAIPPKLTPETLPKSRVPGIFRKVPLSAVRGAGMSEDLVESSVTGTPPCMRGLGHPLQETSGRVLDQGHRHLKRPSVLL